MKPTRLLLCTDLDRTVIPNGDEPEHPLARHYFGRFCQQPEVSLAYVSGRHRALVEQAIQEYALPEPDYVITDVGATIYRLDSGNWRELEAWQKRIARDWRGVKNHQISHSLGSLKELRLQEKNKQGPFKVSFYLPLDSRTEALADQIESCLQQLDVKANLIWSVDEPAQIGLLDILPGQANKLTAILFLQQQLGYQAEELIFAGDSGNDLEVLCSPVQSVLVANASAEIKEQARRQTTQNGQSNSLYLATTENFFLGGNYTAGVLQGVCHFLPEFRQILTRLEGAP